MKKPRSLRKRTVLILLPDRLAKPTSDMGLACFHTVKNLGKDFDFDIVGFPEENALSYYRSAVSVLPNTPDLSASILSGDMAFFFQALQGARRPDIVHAYDWSTYLAGAYAAAYFRVPLIVTVHSSIALLLEQKVTNIPGIFPEIEKVGLTQATRVIHLSRVSEQAFKKMPDISKKTKVISHGVWLEEWAKYQAYKLPGKQKYKIVYAGPLTSMKGVLALCQAKIPEDVDLIFMSDEGSGEAPVFQQVLMKVQDAKNVYFINSLYGQEKVNFFRSVDAVILPSIHEPFGITALEAFASESILLASFREGLSDFLTHDSAIDCGITADSIERALKKFLSLSDEEKAGRIAKGKQIAEKYDWPNVLESLKLLYEEVLL